ncbi:MAG: FCD domain-containing protein [Planctomycetota bacterium]
MVRIEGEKLKLALDAANTNPARLAAKADIDSRTVQTLLTKGSHGCQIGTLERLAKALGIPESQLAPDAPPPQEIPIHDPASSSRDSVAEDALCLRELIEVYFISKLFDGTKVDVSLLNQKHGELSVLAETRPRTDKVIRDFISTDMEFHKELLRLADGEWVIPVWEELKGHWSKLFPERRYQNRGTFGAVLQEHRLIIDAIRKGGKKAACDHLKSHLQASLGRAANLNI